MMNEDTSIVSWNMVGDVQIVPESSHGRAEGMIVVNHSRVMPCIAKPKLLGRDNSSHNHPVCLFMLTYLMANLVRLRSIDIT